MKFLILILAFTSVVKAEQQVSLIGLTLHLTPITNQTAKLLKNKLTSGGQFVYNWQLNYMAINDEGQLIHAAMLQDCFGHGAGFLAYGKRYEVEKNFYLGWELGFYGRQRAWVGQTEDGVNPPITSGIYEFYPSPAVIAQYKLAPNVVIRAQSNLILNSFDIAWAF